MKSGQINTNYNYFTKISLKFRGPISLQWHTFWAEGPRVFGRDEIWQKKHATESRKQTFKVGP